MLHVFFRPRTPAILWFTLAALSLCRCSRTLPRRWGLDREFHIGSVRSRECHPELVCVHFKLVTPHLKFHPPCCGVPLCIRGAEHTQQPCGDSPCAHKQAREVEGHSRVALRDRLDLPAHHHRQAAKAQAQPPTCTGQAAQPLYLPVK